jgi:chemotaxis protein methyltransferase CheR
MSSSSSNSQNYRVSNTKFDDELLEVINRRLGIVVKSSQLNDLRKIVADACSKLKITEKDYLKTLNSANSDSSIMKNLINCITIGETYFFRDEKQMQLIKQTVLPNIINRKRERNDLSIRIWSAGCASGEELYSIIIMLNELLADKKDWQLYFLGTDINSRVLQKALAGEYGEWSMRAISDYYKNKYLKKEGLTYQLDKTIIDQAQFHYLNLNNNSYPSIINGTSALDLILCRNVLIYFDAEHTRDIMKKFSMSLVEDGYLLLGASDPVHLDDTRLVLQPEHGKLLCLREAQPTITTPIHVTLAVVENPVKKTVPKPATKPVKPIVNKPTELTQLIKQRRWPELLNLVDAYPKEKYLTADVLSAKAQALANLGHLKEAAECCELSLKLDSIRLETYFTYAMILNGLADLKHAEAALRKTLFLDRDFVLGHYQLGLMLMRNNDLASGLKSLKNAYTITQQKNPAQSVPGYEDLTYGKLTDILQEEISLHEIGSGAHETE